MEEQNVTMLHDIGLLPRKVFQATPNRHNPSLLFPRELAIPLIRETAPPALGSVSCKSPLETIERDTAWHGVVAGLPDETLGTTVRVFTVWRTRSAVGGGADDRVVAGEVVRATEEFPWVDGGEGSGARNGRGDERSGVWGGGWGSASDRLLDDHLESLDRVVPFDGNAEAGPIPVRSEGIKDFFPKRTTFYSL